MLQLMALHRSTAVPVVGCEGILPAVENLPQFLELVKAHGVGHVPLRQRSQSRTHHILFLLFLYLKALEHAVRTNVSENPHTRWEAM